MCQGPKDFGISEKINSSVGFDSDVSVQIIPKKHEQNTLIYQNSNISKKKMLKTIDITIINMRIATMIAISSLFKGGRGCGCGCGCVKQTTTGFDLA